MFVKSASDANVATTDRLLDRIREENPAHWPYGLSRAHFDGGLYLISKQAGMEPVGFVGWQERGEDDRKVGYYSIGILPDYRRLGYAKRAVAAVLREKAAGVDEVRAMVIASNDPSKALARSLTGVTLLEKAASGKGEILKTLLTGAAGGTSTMLMQDNLMNQDEPFGAQAFRFGENEKGRNLMNIVNFALGAGGAATARKGFQQMGVKGESGIGAAKAGLGLGTMITGPIAKDVMMDSHKAIKGVDRLSKDLPAAVASAKPEPFTIPKEVLYGGLGLGAAGIITAALTARMKRKAAIAQAWAKSEASRQGRVQVKLPPNAPGGAETTLDLPADEINLSKLLESKLRRDTKTRLQQALSGGKKTRTSRDTDEEGNPIPKRPKALPAPVEEPEEEAGMFQRLRERFADLFDKAASAVPAVPSPPAQGTNPALRMSQEAQNAQAMSQGASTDANPQIMQAQQATAAAEQAAQQEVAQAQQAAQQKEMQTEQAYQQELAKKDQEVFLAKQEAEIQKTQIEKSKVEMELAKAKMEAEQEIEAAKKEMTDSLSSSNDSAVSKMTQHRLSRIRSMLSKGAATVAPVALNREPVAQPPQLVANPLQGPVAPLTKQLPGHTAQRINDRGFEFQAMGGFAPTHLYRTSYGKLGDAAYGMLARPFLHTPSQNATLDWSNMAPDEIAAQPDAYDMLMRRGQQVMNTPVF